MSDTPRTDAEVFPAMRCDNTTAHNAIDLDVVPASFARGLERELNARIAAEAGRLRAEAELANTATAAMFRWREEQRRFHNPIRTSLLAARESVTIALHDVENALWVLDCANLDKLADDNEVKP